MDENETVVLKSTGRSKAVPKGKLTVIEAYVRRQENLKFYSIKHLSQKDTCTSVFIVALLTIAKIRKQPKCARVDKKGMVFLYTVEYYSAIKK